MPGTRRIPFVTGFFWDHPNGDVYVSSYGRGLWKISLGKDCLDATPDRIRFVPKPGSDTVVVLSDLVPGPAIAVGGAIGPDGTPIVAPGFVSVSGAGFSPTTGSSATIDLMLDGEFLASAALDSQGSFAVTVDTSLAFGLHRIEVVRPAEDAEVKDQLTAEFLVAPVDMGQSQPSGSSLQ